MKTPTISYYFSKKTVLTGVFAILAVVGIGFSVGLGAGVFDVPFAHAGGSYYHKPTCTLTATNASAGSATLSWTTAYATSASIDNGVGDVTTVDAGSLAVAAASATTYTMTVSGPGGQGTCSAAVSVAVALAVSCAASSASVVAGDSVTWTAAIAAAGAGSYSYSWSGTDGLTGSAASVSQSYATSGTKSATVTVTAGTQTATATCSTIVTNPPPPPVDCTLSANPTSVASGDSSTLSWTTSGATTFSIDHGIGNETATSSGSDSTGSLTATTTFTGTAMGPGGTKNCTATVAVVATPPPPATPTCTLSANPSTINQGDSANLTWTTTNATSFSINQGIGSVTPVAGGNKSVTPSSDTSYTGTATGPGGTVKCYTKVMVQQQNSCNLMVSCAASASSAQIGDQVTWSASATGNMGNPISYSWSGTDSLSGTSSTVNKSYATSGTKNATVTVTSGSQTATASCSTTVTSPPPPSVTCSLSASPTSVTKGGSSKLSWNTTNAITFTIDQSIGAVTPVGSGSTDVTPSVTTTYTGTATGPAGTVTCMTKIKVVTPSAPTCTLTATPDSIKPGAMSTLSWTTTNATSFAIDQGIGSTTPVAGGSEKVSPDTTTTYTGTASGPGGSVTCPATVTVTQNPPPPPAPTCTLSASPSQVSAVGGTTVLSWTTTDATSFAIDNGVGMLSSLASGTTTSPAIAVDTTFTGTVTGPGGTATCTTPVTVPTGGGGGPSYSCSLTASPNALGVGGGATELSWGGQNIQSVFIDNGVGTTTSVTGTTSVSVSSNTTYTGTFLATNGQTLTCQATVSVQTGGGGGGGGGCAGNCGGGGGGGGAPQPSVVLAALPHIGNAPLAFLYLSQIPYTGLDLGPIGTIIYWAALILWSLAAAYLVLFGAFPYLAGRMKRFGASVADALKAAPATSPAYAYAPAKPTAPAPVIEPEQGRMSTYTAYDGFKSLASGDKLSIEDIVKGLSRQMNNPGVSGESHEWVDAAPAPHAVEPSVQRSFGTAPAMYEKVEPIYENVEPITPEAPKAAPSAPMFMSRTDTAPVAKAESFPPEVPDFLSMLVAGNREAVFEMYRGAIRSGVDSETFLTQVACALDDAYRARIEGTPVHPEVSRHTNNLATPVLEKLVNALSTAVDSSYSLDITGGKLALTRALATLGA